jgi:membrane protein implicated in regulation of membrane protease activity
MNLLKINISKQNFYETGLILLFVDLLWIYHDFHNFQVIIGIVLVVILLLVPKIFFPLSWILIFCGKLLNWLIPPIILAVVFYLVVTPVSILRRLFSKDSLKITEFKKDKNSLFSVRNKLFKKEDILHPY